MYIVRFTSCFEALSHMDYNWITCVVTGHV
jgi:hypothetical protein